MEIVFNVLNYGKGGKWNKGGIFLLFTFSFNAKYTKNTAWFKLKISSNSMTFNLLYSGSN